MTNKELKQEIRRLKKIKLQCKPGSPERIDLHRRIKNLKEQSIKATEVNIEKQKLINKIKELEPKFPYDLIDLNKFTEEQLNIHIGKLKARLK